MAPRRLERSTITAAAGITLIFLSRAALCADEGVPSLRHRMGIATGYGPGMVVIDGIESDQSRDSGNLFSLLATYAYQVNEGLEVGVGLSYWNGPDALSAVAAALRLRPYVPVSKSVEIGLSLGGGVLIWPHALPSEALTKGPFFSLGIDGSFWVSRSFGMECFVQIAGANGPGPAHSSAGFYSAGAGIGWLARL